MSFRTHRPEDYRAALAYLAAKKYVIDRGYWLEAASLGGVGAESLTEAAFLREAAWVVLSAGMRESVVRKKFDGVSEAFLMWASASAIVEKADQCIADAMPHFGSARKLHAIARIASVVARSGFGLFKAELVERPLETIAALPFMGPATSRHLAKNVGVDVAKPDRHLVRFAAAAGGLSVEELCANIAGIVGDSVAMIDTVLWRYAALSPAHLGAFALACSRSES